MRLTAEQVFIRLLTEDKITEKKGQIRFYLGDVDIIVKARDVVGNIMQEWLEGWLKKNGIEYLPNPNSQMPPDFFLNKDDKTTDLLEVKAFNYNATPGFDIADFNSFQEEIIDKPYMLHTKYLIFGYVMQPDGYVIIKKMWLKNVWELCRPMEKWPLNLQIKDKVVHKIRPGKWYSSGKSIKFKQFDNLEDFISALSYSVWQNPKTKGISGEWEIKFKQSYEKFYNTKITIPRWIDIMDNYYLKKQK
ncbi:MAG: NgoBV family restriction endonuclease [Prevotella sp.]